MATLTLARPGHHWPRLSPSCTGLAAWLGLAGSGTGFVKFWRLLNVGNVGVLTERFVGHGEGGERGHYNSLVH